MLLSKIIRLVYAILYLIDIGYDFPIERIKIVIDDKYVFDYIEQKTISEQFNISFLSEQEKDWFIEQFILLQKESDGAENIGRVQNNGLCLVIAYLNELILRKKFQ